MSRPEPTPEAAVRVAYLITEYPKISHTFIRREILALEEKGVQVLRIALRGHETGALDASDAAEANETRCIVGTPLGEVVRCCLTAAARSPAAFVRTLVIALGLGRRCDGGAMKHLAYFVEACILKIWLDRADIKHVHAHFGTNAAAIVMLCKMLGGPRYSFTVHGPDEFDRPKRLALREKIRHAQFVVAISSFCRSQLYCWSEPVDWPKIQVVHCALEPSYFTAGVAPIPDEPRMVCVGRLSPEKGQLLMVQAADAVAAGGVAIDVILAGDGPLRKDIEREIAHRALKDVVHLAGWVDNRQVRELLLQSRALVVSSFAEGLPVVIMEAFALRRPVIATAVAGIPELVKDGLNGWLITAGDVASLTRAMQEAATETPSRLAAMGEAGHKLVFEQHNTAIEAEKLKTLFLASLLASLAAA